MAVIDSIPELTYNEAGLIPCIVQDAKTREVLMMAWMNAESVRLTLKERTTWFFSRSRQELWHKGTGGARRPRLPHGQHHLLLPRDGVGHRGSPVCALLAVSPHAGQPSVESISPIRARQIAHRARTKAHT